MRRIGDLMDLRGRTALVVGGAGHLGRAAAGALAELGAGVALLDLHGDTCQAAAVEVAREHDVTTLGLGADITDESAGRRAVEEVVDRLGSLEVLVFSAALVGTSPLPGWIAPLEEQSTQTWSRALDVNLTAAFTLTKAAAPHLVVSGRGSLITISSIYGLVGPDLSLYDGLPMGNPAAYAASKGGLQAFTRWASTVLAPHVRANCITPGGIARGQDPAFQERYAQRTPLRRLATEEDMVGAVAYLASDLSAYVTGQNLVVDGGFTAW